MPILGFLRPSRLIVVLALLLLGAVAVGDASAQENSYPVTLTMTGPSTAEPGQEIAYRVRYELTDPATMPGTAVGISFSRNATFVSTQIISGTDGVLGRHSDRAWRWSDLGNSIETMGEIEMVVRINDDFRGSISARAHVPGTNTTSSNVVETQVFAPGTLPNTGQGQPTGPRGFNWLAVVVATSGALLLVGAMATSRRHG